MERSKTLDLAKQSVTTKNALYGTPSDNFGRIAVRWSAHLANIEFEGGEALDESSVAIMMADVKLARLENDPTHLDSWVDGAGYMACGAEVSEAAEFQATVAIAGTPADWWFVTADGTMGFQVDETVNLKIAPFGMDPGTVVGFGDGLVLVKWSCGVGATNPAKLRHGP